MLRTAPPEIITDTLPGPKAQALIDRRAQAVPAAIRCVYPVAIARGEGAMLEDLDGNRFLDARTQRFVRRMQRETGGDEEDWDDPT